MSDEAEETTPGVDPRGRVAGVLCVGGDAETLAAAREAVDDGRRVVHRAESIADARSTLEAGGAAVDCVVAEFRLPDGDGLELLESVRDRRDDLPFVLLDDGDNLRAAVEAGVTAYVERGGDWPETLAARVDECVEPDPARRAAETYRAGFEALANAPATVLVSVDEDSTITYVSDPVRSVFGYEPAELLGEPLTALVPDRLEAAHREGFESYLESGERSLDWSWIELPGRHKDGHEIPLGITFGEAVVDGERYFTGLLRDVSEQRQVERRQRDNQAALRELYEVSSDPDLGFEEKVERLLEIGRDRLGVAFGFLTEIDEESDRQRVLVSRAAHPGLRAGQTCPLSEAYCRKTVRSDGLLAVQNAPEEGWVDDPAYERFDLGSYIGAKVSSDEGVFGTLCFASHDPREEPFSEFERTFVELMAEWVSYELERVRRTRDLQRQNERLDEFVSIVSHDLRNPLGVIKGSLELYEETGEPSDLRRARDAADRMEALVEDMLTLARQGETVESFEAVSLPAVVEEGWSVVPSEAATLAVETDAEVWADASRVQQLLENLFRNAIEHGSAADDGGVTVTVGDLGDGFYVEDDGPGIPEADREEVFDPGVSRSESGTGYGLSIVARIADAHGWKVRVTDGDAGGARFEFTDVEPAH